MPNNNSISPASALPEYPTLAEFQNKQNRKQKIQIFLLVALILLLIGISVNLIFQYQKSLLEGISPAP